MAPHLKLLVRRGTVVALLLSVLGAPLAVNTGTQVRRVRSSGLRSRVARSAPYTGRAREEGVESLWVTAHKNDLIVPASDPGAVSFPSCPLQPTSPAIVVDGVITFVATPKRRTASPPAPPRGPPLDSRYSLI